MQRTKHRDKYAHLRPHAGDRSHYRADGTPKRPLTEEDAETIIQRRALMGLNDMHTYKCPACPMWHVGRPPLPR